MIEIFQYILFHIIFDSPILVVFFTVFPIVLLVNWIISIVKPSSLADEYEEIHMNADASKLDSPGNEIRQKQTADNSADSIRHLLIEIALSVWATKKYFLKLITENDLSRKGRQLNSQINRLESVLQSLNIEIEDYTGVKYNESMNITPVDYEESEVSAPVIKETIEPTILMNNEICKKAKVIVAVPAASKNI